MLVLNAKRIANMLAWGIFAFSLFSEPNLTYSQIRPVRFIPLGDAPGGDFCSSASAASADGRVVVGNGVNDRGPVALRWTEQEGITEIPPAYPEKKYRSTARGVSSDGNTVIGESSSTASFRGVNMSQGYIWTAEKGIHLLGSLPGGFPASAARAVSGDGTIVVGQVAVKGGPKGFTWTLAQGMNKIPSSSTVLPQDAWRITSDGIATVGVATEFTNDGPLLFSNGKRGRRVAFRILNTGEPEALGILPEHFSSVAMDASRKGKYVIGGNQKKRGGGSQAFIWDATQGMRGLGYLPEHDNSRATAISDDGRIVVGFSASGKENQTAFIWTRGTGIQNLQTLAETAGIDLNGWLLKYASDISADGSTIVGSGTNPQGKWEGWIMRLTGASK